MELEMKVMCRNSKEVEVVKRKTRELARSFRRLRKESFDYEVTIENLENDSLIKIINKRNPRE